MSSRAWLLLGLSLAKVVHAQVFEPSTGLNPLQAEFKPEPATRALFELGWCGVGIGGFVATKPAGKLTLRTAVKNVKLQGSVPFALLLPGSKVYCSDRFGAVDAQELPAGELQFFPVGLNPKALANADYGYQPGQAVTLLLDAKDEPVRLSPPPQTVTWSPGDAPLVVRAKYPDAASARALGDAEFGAVPLALVEVKGALEKVRLLALNPPAEAASPRVELLPLDVPRKKQREWLAGDNPFSSHADKPLLPGRYALLSSPGAGPVRVVLSAGEPSPLFVATTEADLPAYAGVAGAVLHLHAPFVEHEQLQPKTPAELKDHLALWKAVPTGLRVTLVVDRQVEVLGGGEVTVRAGEPLLVTEATTQGAKVVTADGLDAEFDDELLTRTAPAQWVVPERSRAFESTDDDSLLLFMTPALAKVEASFKQADEKASACWAKNYNPAGQNYDVVTYRNGRVVNVESLDDRFRAKAEKACKGPLAAAEKLRAQLFKALAPEAKRVRAQAWDDVKALFAK
ncbi:MAG: hypothetical protein ACOZQL_27500 [Myxococcota bacterium]